MSSRRTALSTGLAAAALLGSWRRAGAQAAPTLERVLANHARARGGVTALDAVRSMASDMTIVEKGLTLAAHYVATVEPRMRIDVRAGGVRVWSEGLDARGAWEQPADLAHARPASATAGATLRRGVTFNLHGLHAFPRLGCRLSLAGPDTVDGTSYVVVQVDMPDGYRAFLYINPKTWMIERRRDFRALHPAFDTTQKWLEDVYEDFRDVGGVRVSFASHQVDLVSGAVLQHTRFTGYALNPPLPIGALERS